MRLITYNVEYCQGINKKWKYLELQKYVLIAKKNLEKMTEYLRLQNPDILGLIEIDLASYRFRRRSPIEFFAEALKMEHWVAKTKYARRSFFYKVLNFTPVFRRHANAIVSKYPLFDTHYYLLMRGVKRLVIHTKIKIVNKGKVVNVNLFAIHLALTKFTRQRQLEEISRFVNSFDGPKIVFGDFNVFKGKEEIKPLLEGSNLVNAADYTKQYDIKTYPSWKPKRHLDHVLVSKDIHVKNYEVLDVQFSDHLPVMVDFELK